MFTRHRSWHRLQHGLILGIIWLALAVRLIYLAYVNELPPNELLFAPLCGVDAHIYDQYGQDLLAGNWPGTTPLFRTPLYTIYLGFIYRLTTYNHLTPLIVQALVQAVAVAALYKAGCIVFSRTAGLLAALGYALYGSTIYFVGCFAQISLVLPALIFVLDGLLEFDRNERRIWWLAGAGLILGLAGLGRPTVLALMLAVLVWLVLRQAAERQWVKHAVIFFVGVLLPVVPVTVFNYNVSGRFIPVSANGPEVLFISNNLDAEGRDILAPGIGQPVHKRMERVVAEIERHETTYTNEVIDYIRAEPLDWVVLELNKLWLLFGKSDLNLLTIAFAYSTTAQQIDIFEVVPLRWHGLVVSAFLGMILIRRPQSTLLLLFFLAITLATVIFFVQLRFRLLLVPIVILYAAALLAAGRGWFRSTRKKFYTVLLILILFIPLYRDVWPFALILLGTGVWQAVRLELWSVVKWPLLASWSLFVLALLIGQITDSVGRTGQNEDYYQGPEISGDRWLGQTFRPHCDGLNRVRLTPGLPNVAHDQPVTFHLRLWDDGREIFSGKISAQSFEDRANLEFRFPPQLDSSQHTYLAFLTSPTSYPGNSITLRGFSNLPVDWYPQGTAIVGEGGQLLPFPGDLAFSASCTEHLPQSVRAAFANLPGSQWFYWVVFIGHFILLVVSGFKVVQQLKWNNRV